MKRKNIHTHNRVLFSVKKEGNPITVINTDELEDIMLSDISQAERQILHGLIYMWNLKKSSS